MYFIPSFFCLKIQRVSSPACYCTMWLSLESYIQQPSKRVSSWQYCQWSMRHNMNWRKSTKIDDNPQRSESIDRRHWTRNMKVLRLKLAGSGHKVHHTLLWIGPLYKLTMDSFEFMIADALYQHTDRATTWKKQLPWSIYWWMVGSGWLEEPI